MALVAVARRSAATRAAAAAFAAALSAPPGRARAYADKASLRAGLVAAAAARAAGTARPAATPIGGSAGAGASFAAGAAQAGGVLPAGLPAHTVMEMPALSPTMESGTLSEWAKAEGDEVAAGDVLATIETDKSSMAWEAMDDGYVARLLVPEGTQDVAVGRPVLVMVEEAEDAKAFKEVAADAFGSVAGGGGAEPSATGVTAAPAAPSAAVAAGGGAPVAAPTATAKGDVPRRRRRYKHAATGWTLTEWY
eukprot:PRCOL_00000632-RA